MDRNGLALRQMRCGSRQLHISVICGLRGVDATKNICNRLDEMYIFLKLKSTMF